MAEGPKRLLVSIPEAGEMLGLKRSSIYNLLNDGAIESVKIGKKRRLVRVDSLERYVERLSANQ